MNDERIRLGDVPIDIQNESGPNEDYYRIGAEAFRGAYTDRGEISRAIARSLEDPERFAFSQEAGSLDVYTRQPDAAVELAVYLNRQRGVDVTDLEAEAVRKQLTRKQRARS